MTAPALDQAWIPAELRHALEGQESRARELAALEQRRAELGQQISAIEEAPNLPTQALREALSRAGEALGALGRACVVREPRVIAHRRLWALLVEIPGAVAPPDPSSDEKTLLARWERIRADCATWGEHVNEWRRAVSSVKTLDMLHGGHLVHETGEDLARRLADFAARLEEVERDLEPWVPLPVAPRRRFDLGGHEV